MTWKASPISATLIYNGQEFKVAVESVQTEHIGHRPFDHDSLSSLGVDGRRYIMVANPRQPLTRVTITGIITPPVFIELPFVRRDRFTLAAFLPKSEDDDFGADDANDWD